MVKLFILYWIVSGIANLFWVSATVNNPKIFGKFKEGVEDTADEFQIPVEIMFAMLYASYFLFGFVSIPVYIYRAIVRGIKKNG